ncbi:MAG: BON domain-containing protein [Rubripirellula sp.]
MTKILASFSRRLLLTLSVVGLGQTLCNAQVFGRPRQIGRPLTRQPSASNLEEVGQITGTERFLRQNRGRAAFVGADRSERDGFVGSQQAQTSDTILSSTAGLNPPADRLRLINRPMRSAKKGEMHLPKIVLGFERPIDGELITPHDGVTARAQRAVRLASNSLIEVSVQGRTAMLRGWVASESEKRLAETLILFEPGISEVVNAIRVQGPPIPIPPPPPDRPFDSSPSN